MGHVRDKFHVDAPIEAVWELGTNANRFVEWQTNLVDIKDVSGPADRAGTTYTAVYRIAGRKIEGHWEIARAEKPSLLEFKGTAPGGGKAAATNRLERAGTGTDVTFEMDYELPGGVVGDIADKLFMERALERDVKHSNENFKALCEAKIPAHA